MMRGRINYWKPAELTEEVKRGKVEKVENKESWTQLLHQGSSQSC